MVTQTKNLKLVSPLVYVVCGPIPSSRIGVVVGVSTYRLRIRGEAADCLAKLMISHVTKYHFLPSYLLDVINMGLALAKSYNFNPHTSSISMC